MIWLKHLLDEPPKLSATESLEERPEPSFDLDLPELLPAFPILTDCPLCGARDATTCGCFD